MPINWKKNGGLNENFLECYKMLKNDWSISSLILSQIKCCRAYGFFLHSLNTRNKQKLLLRIQH